MRSIFCILLFLGVLAIGDGGFVFEWEDVEPGIVIDEADQSAIIYYDKGYETLIISVGYKGPSINFAWLIPTPSQPEVHLAPSDIFSKIEEIAKRGRLEGETVEVPADLLGDFPSHRESGEGKKEINIYDISPLSVKTPEELLNWCKKEGYWLPIQAIPILSEYINNGWSFTAVRIKRQGIGLLQGWLAPLQLRFRTSRIIYPLRISYINRLSLSPKVVVYDELSGHPVIFEREGEQLKAKVIERVKEDLNAGRNFEGSILYRLGFTELRESYKSVLNNLLPLETLLSLVKIKVDEDVKAISGKEHNSLVIYTVAPFKVEVGKETNPQLASFINIPYSVKIKSKEVGELLIRETNNSHTLKKAYLTKVYGNPLFVFFQDDLVLARSTITFKFIAFLLCLFGPLIYIGIGFQMQNHRLFKLLQELEQKGKDFHKLLRERDRLLSELISLAEGYIKNKNLLADLKSAHDSLIKERTVEGKAKLEEKVKEKLTEIFITLKDNPQLKENESFLRLREELLRLVKRMGIEIAHYIRLVRKHNELVRSIPIVFFKKPTSFMEDEALANKEFLH